MELISYIMHNIVLHIFIYLFLWLHVLILCDLSDRKHATLARLAPTWQYFGTITCDGLHGIMKLYIDKP